MAFLYRVIGYSWCAIGLLLSNVYMLSSQTYGWLLLLWEGTIRLHQESRWPNFFPLWHSILLMSVSRLWWGHFVWQQVIPLKPLYQTKRLILKNTPREKQLANQPTTIYWPCTCLCNCILCANTTLVLIWLGQPNVQSSLPMGKGKCAKKILSLCMYIILLANLSCYRKSIDPHFVQYVVLIYIAYLCF